MDFFSAQDEARKYTKWLMLLFVAAVLAIIGVLYSVVIVGVSYSNTASAAEPIVWWQPAVFLVVAGVTSTVIFLGSLYKTVALASGGGDAVAESLGGRLITRNTRDRLEQRLLNVVDEMAIASGVPVPKVYLMDEERSINAFAAGYDIQSAVVAVTRGSLEQLSRDELQGVVAHEFSHILNGDMRINIRLIGVLHGILLLALAGRFVLRGSRGGSGKNAGAVLAVGIALLVVGYVGLFFGRILKAAVSRQREYLADAAGVQFTRNPGGLAGALKKIGGFSDNTIEHPNAEEASHMFFDTGVVMNFNLFATHPPLDERIRRIEPMFRGESGTNAAAGSVGSEAVMGLAGGATINVTPKAVSDSVGNSDERHLEYARHLLAGVPEALMADLHDSNYARSVVYALVAASQTDPQQVLPLALTGEMPEVVLRAQQHLDACRRLERAVRVPLIELAIPAISELDGNRSALLLDCLTRLVEHDSRVTVFEYAVLSLVGHALGVRAEQAGGGKGRDMGRLREDCTVVLSLLAHAGHHREAEAMRAFNEAVGHLAMENIGELMSIDTLSLSRFSGALAHIGILKYRFKAGVIEACVAAIAADGKVTFSEAEMLRAIGARLDCPIPPMLPGALDG